MEPIITGSGHSSPTEFLIPKSVSAFYFEKRKFQKKVQLCFSYLLLGLEHIAAEDITLSISRDVAENLQILGVMRHIEYPEKTEKNRSNLKNIYIYMNMKQKKIKRLAAFRIVS